MSPGLPFDGAVTSAAEFEAALGHLLDTAASAGVDPRGSWEYRGNGTHPDLEVMVVELEGRGPSG